MPEEQFWAEALVEFDGKSRRPGLWAKAFSEAQGSEAVAKATYLKVRAGELRNEHQEDVAAKNRKERDEARRAELAQLSEEQRAYELSPKGRCPNCKMVIPLASKECTKCFAMFTDDGWKVLPLENT